MSERPFNATPARQVARLEKRTQALETQARLLGVTTSDPPTLLAGMIWLRSDTGQLCWFDGVAVHRIP